MYVGLSPVMIGPNRRTCEPHPASTSENVTGSMEGMCTQHLKSMQKDIQQTMVGPAKLRRLADSHRGAGAGGVSHSILVVGGGIVPCLPQDYVWNLIESHSYYSATIRKPTTSFEFTASK